MTMPLVISLYWSLFYKSYVLFMQIFWRPCASSKFVCNKPLRFGFRTYLLTQRSNCRGLIIVSLSIYPILRGTRAWSTLYTLLGQACLDPEELSMNKKPLTKPCLLHSASTHIVSSGKRTLCVKGRYLNKTGRLKLLLRVVSFQDLIFSCIKQICIRDFQVVVKFRHNLWKVPTYCLAFSVLAFSAFLWIR